MIGTRKITILAMACLLNAMIMFQGSEACRRELCERYCENGYYETDTVNQYGYPCRCRCCPPIVCRKCFLRKKVVAPDTRGCKTCKCGWYF